MNALIFTEDNNLHITQQNGLRYNYDNVSKPNLGFDFDVIIYDNRDEYKVVNYDDTKPFDQQNREPLTDTDRDAIESFITNSEPPQGVSLADQHCGDLQSYVDDMVNDMCGQYRFNDMTQVVYSRREGSNHPFRSDARRVMEYADATYSIFFQVVNEIQSTREDYIKDFESYSNQIPTPITNNSLS